MPAEAIFDTSPHVPHNTMVTIAHINHFLLVLDMSSFGGNTRAEHTCRAIRGAMAPALRGSCFADHSFVLRLAAYSGGSDRIIIGPERPTRRIRMKITAIEAIHLRAADPL